MNPLLRLSNLIHDVENTITPTIPDDYCSTAMLHDGYRATDVSNYPTTTNLHDGCRTTEYPTTTNLHQGCRATDFPNYPTTTNLHDGCRTTDADCGTSRPFIAIQTTPRKHGEDSKRCPVRTEDRK